MCTTMKERRQHNINRPAEADYGQFAVSNQILKKKKKKSTKEGLRVENMFASRPGCGEAEQGQPGPRSAQQPARPSFFKSRMTFIRPWTLDDAGL